MDDIAKMAENLGPSRVLSFQKYHTHVVSNLLPSLFLGLFLATLDTSIVATALVTILTEFDDFARSEWIVLAYLLTYMSTSSSNCLCAESDSTRSCGGFCKAQRRLWKKDYGHDRMDHLYSLLHWLWCISVNSATVSPPSTAKRYLLIILASFVGLYKV